MEEACGRVGGKDEAWKECIGVGGEAWGGG